MKSILKLINSDAGKYIISIILGIGLASLFKKACKDRKCVVFRAPSMKDIKDKIFNIDDKCYKFNEKSVTCTKDAEPILFE